MAPVRASTKTLHHCNGDNCRWEKYNNVRYCDAHQVVCMKCEAWAHNKGGSCPKCSATEKLLARRAKDAETAAKETAAKQAEENAFWNPAPERKKPKGTKKVGFANSS